MSAFAILRHRGIDPGRFFDQRPFSASRVAIILSLMPILTEKIVNT
jgi:hypothetical protein